MILLSVSLALLAIIAAVAFWIISLRRVVSTNEVHIIQSGTTTVSYGKDQDAGNTYYEWPFWMPIIGIQVIKLSVAVFSLNLKDYEAYDKGRLPFLVDLEAFFRIENSNIAAQRVVNMQELNGQLSSILKGATRTILASKTIEEIMQGRSEFGDAFTKEVKDQLAAWGVTTVKNIELMDIRNTRDSKVIHNIMEKKKSEIEKESRIVVATNKKNAMNAEIDAEREIEINKQLAQQQVGIRTAEKEKEVGLAQERTTQEIKEQQKITIEKTMEVEKVEQFKTAEIAKEVHIIKANELKEIQIIGAEANQKKDILQAEGEKQKTILVADGNLEAEKRVAEALILNGQAKAESEKLLQLAPVEAQIVLAKEIGENQSYQQYLITIRQIEANQAIGIEQAKALDNADIKVIANSGTVTDGVKSLGDLFTSKGGVGVASALEGLAQSEIGKNLIEKFTKS